MPPIHKAEKFNTQSIRRLTARRIDRNSLGDKAHFKPTTGRRWMDILTNIVLVISCLTCPLFWCIPQNRRLDYFRPSSRILGFVDNVGFAACVLMIGRLTLGYQWTTLDRTLFVVATAGITIHNVSMFVVIKCFSDSSSDAPATQGR